MNTLGRSRKLWLWLPAVATIVTGCFPDESSNSSVDVELGSAGFDKPRMDAVAQTRYEIIDLGVNNSKDNFSMAMGLNKQGWAENMDGTVNPPENNLFTSVSRGRAVISIYGFNIDLGTLGKPDANSWINWGGINDRGEAVGMSETADLDPNGEDICGFGTHLTCVPFLWRSGHMSADPTCPPAPIALPVLWEKGHAQPLPLVGTDPDGFAFGINDQGQAVGYSGSCI